MQKNKLVMILSLTMMSLIGACGKKRPLEVAVKNDHELVSSVKTDKDFIYLISVSDADSRVQASRPHWMSSSKLVRFSFNKSSLDVRQLVDDPRFKDNPANEKPILSIPVEYKNYRCKENDFKECTNKEEVDDDTYWDKKKYFVPDYEKLEVTEQSFLPLALDELDEGCWAKTGQRLVSSELKEESLNLEIERTYRAKSFSCAEGVAAGSIGELLDALVFKVRYHISVVEASKLTDSRYQEVIYPQGDQSAFGFFTTDETRLDIDNRPTADKVLTKMNRWSPNRKELVYYLNAPFESEAYAKIKQQTQKVAEAVNSALKEAGSNINFKIQSAPKGMSSEDLRHSMIVMVPEPMDSGLLGYGPTAVNPKTGEIVHARVVMYLGNIKQYIYRTWDEVVLDQIARKNPPKTQGQGDGKPVAEAQKSQPKAVEFADQLMTLGPALKLPSLKKWDGKGFIGKKVPGGIAVENNAQVLTALTKFMKSPSSNKHSLVTFGQGKEVEDGDIDGFMNKHLSELEYYSRNNYYPGDYFGFENAILSAYKGEIPANLLKTWSQMAESERAQVIDLVLPIAWTVTLIHEIGHTLGLRHNFDGSEDKENFYSQEELKSKGIDHDIKISSVMEYPFEDIGALPVMGKYDIAALRFGYARKALMADGKTLIDIDDNGFKAKQTALDKEYAALPKDQQTPEAKQRMTLKRFGFCTDEHVDANPGCKRFDTGTNLKEIAQHQIDVYEKYYKYRNFRYGRRFFNLSSDGSYLSRTGGMLRDMRLFFERYETIKELVPDETKWETDPDLDAETRDFLKNLREGVRLIGNHLMSIIVQPDITCLYKVKGSETIFSLPMVMLQDPRANPGRESFSPNLYSCMRDLRNTEQVEWMGQIGRNFSSRKDPQTENPYVDEIDVRGIMIDKVLASHYLLTRYLGSLSNDTTTSNFMDIPELRERLVKLYMALILDEVPVKITTTLKDGTPFKYEGMTSLHWTHMIRPSESGRVNRVLQIKKGQTPFADKLLEQINRYNWNERDPKGSEDIRRIFSVEKNLNSKDIEGREFEVITASDGNKFYIAPENTLAGWIAVRWFFAQMFEPFTDEIKMTLAVAMNADRTREEIQKALTKTIKEDMEVKDEKVAAEILAKSLELYDTLAKRADGKVAINMAANRLIKSQAFYETMLSRLLVNR